MITPGFIGIGLGYIGGGLDPDAFVLSVKTDNAGTSNSDQFTIPLESGETYDFSVAYDGQSTAHSTATDLTLTFPSGAGTYDVAITGTFPAIFFNNGGDKLKVLELKQWGTGTWTTFQSAFYGCANMDITATDHATAGTGSVISFGSAWRGCASLTSFPLIDTGSGTNFYAAFHSCASLTSFPLIDTGSATNFSHTWYGCTNLTSFPLIDTGSVTDFSRAWYQCTGLTAFPLIDTGLVTDFSRAWYQCTSLTSFPTINTSSGITFLAAWLGCTGLNGYDFPTLDMSAMTDGGSAFLSVTLSTQSWSDLLVYIEANNTDLDCVLSGGNSLHNAAGTTAINALTGRTPGWTITDGGAA